MQFTPHQPSSALRPYIESIFHIKGFTPEHSIERVVPDGFIYLIIELDGFKRNTFENNTLKPIAEFTEAWLSGLHKYYISISAHENSEMYVVQFKPGGLQPFLNIPVSQVSNQVISARVLLGNSIVQLRDELLASAVDTDKMFLLGEKYLLNSAKFDHSPARKLVEELVAAIHKNSASRLGDIVERSAYSQKQAIKIFKQHVGLNPKTFQRIVRFSEVLPLVMENKTVAWSELCAECYYYDQSHFIREFKAFCGYSPSNFVLEQANYPHANFFPLD